MNLGDAKSGQGVIRVVIYKKPLAFQSGFNNSYRFLSYAKATCADLLLWQQHRAISHALPLGIALLQHHLQTRFILRSCSTRSHGYRIDDDARFLKNSSMVYVVPLLDIPASWQCKDPMQCL